MFKYFNCNNTLTDVFNAVNREANDKPKIIISDYNTLIDKKISKRDTEDDIVLKEFSDLIQDQLTLEFIVFDNKYTVEDMEDGFDLNNMIDTMYSQNILNKDYFYTYEQHLDSNRNICFVKGDNKKKNFLLNALIDDKFYKSFDIPIKTFVMFSSILDTIEFLLKYKINNNVCIILFELEKNSKLQFYKDILQVIQKHI